MFYPADTMKSAFAAMQMMSEAQAVIAYRLCGMAGLWTVAANEDHRMVSEKGPAFTAANLAAFRAMSAGKRPDQVYAAWLKPIGRKTRANAARLRKRGPRLSV